MANSSLIRRPLYRPDVGELDLLLSGGRRYIYSDVPLAVAEGFRDAESKGRFYTPASAIVSPAARSGRHRAAASVEPATPLKLPRHLAVTDARYASRVERGSDQS